MAEVGVAPQPELAYGQFQYNEVLKAGGQKLADQYKAEQTAKLQEGGSSPASIAAFWGEAPPNSSGVNETVKTNLQRSAPGLQPKVATNPMEALAAGWDNSDVGLITQKHLPDLAVAQHAPLLHQIAAAAGQELGDLPAQIGGFMAGGAAGAAVPGANLTGIPEVVGAGAGAAAVPEALRQSLIVAYRRGEYKTTGDLLTAVGAGTVATLKAGLIGGVAGAAGGVVGGKALQVTGSKLLGQAAESTAQVVAATTSGAALEGRIPDAEDFGAAAALALGLHVGGIAAGKVPPVARTVQSNLQKVYATTGIPPWEAVKLAQARPELMQELVHQDPTGQPVTPKLKEAAPSEPPHYGQPPTGSDAWAQNRVQLATEGVERLKQIVRPLETGGLTHPDNAISAKGAVSAFQIMPGTARQYGFDPTKVAQDPTYAAHAAETILTALNLHYHGDEAAVLAAYNAGPGRANDLVRSGPGTRLEATPDKTVPGGYRYESVPSGRDESHLPLETQKYIAKGRVIAQGLKGGPVEEGETAAPPGLREPDHAAIQRPPGATEPRPPQEPAPTEEGAEPAPMDTRTAYDEIGKQIADEATKPKLADGDTLYRQFISELGPARQIDRGLAEFGFDKNKDFGVEDAFRQTYGSDQRASLMIRSGAIDPHTMSMIKDSPNFYSAAKMATDAGGNMADWTRYMLAKRAADLAERDIKSGFNNPAVHAILQDPAEVAKYQEATKHLNDSLTGVLRYAQGKGLYSKEQVDAMIAANPTYLTMKRAIDAAKGVSGGDFTPRQLAKIKGSDRQIVDPIESTMWNIHRIVANADRNAAVGVLVQLAEKGMIPETIGLTKIAEEPIPVKDGETSPDPEAAIAQEQRLKSDPEANTFTYFRNGVKETWQTKDPALAALMRRADTPGEANLIMKIAQGFAGLERTGIVGAPDFPFRIMLRHQLQAFVADPTHPPPIITWLRGAVHAIKGPGDPYFDDWVAKGGAGVSLQEMDVNTLQGDITKIFEETGFWKSALNVAGNGNPLQFGHNILDALRLVSERLDAAARIGYMKRAVEDKGIDPLKAATMGREAYMDYSEKGTLALMQGWAKVVPFLRPHLLGLKQLGNAFAERPISTSAYTALGFTTPALALALMNTLQDRAKNPDGTDAIPDDQKYRNVPRWQKDTQFVLPIINGVRIKIPMPPVIGPMAAGLPTRFVEWLADNNPHAFEGWAKSTLDQLIPNLLPTPAVPPLETAANYSFQNGRPLIPDRLKDLSPDMQYEPSTSVPARALSRVLGDRVGLHVWNMSPIAIDQYIKDWGGTMGMTALKILGQPFKEPGPPSELADIPFIQSFIVRHPNANAQGLEDFYTEEKRFTEANADYAMAKQRMLASVMSGGESGQQEFQETSANTASYVHLAQVARAVSIQHQVINGLVGNPKMGVDEKRQKIEQAYIDMLHTAEEGREIMAEIK